MRVILLLLMIVIGAHAQMGAYRYVSAPIELRQALMDRGWVTASAVGAQVYPCQVLKWGTDGEEYVARDCRGEVVYRGRNLPTMAFSDEEYESRYVPVVGKSVAPVVEEYRTV